MYMIAEHAVGNKYIDDGVFSGTLAECQEKIKKIAATDQQPRIGKAYKGVDKRYEYLIIQFDLNESKRGGLFR